MATPADKPLAVLLRLLGYARPYLWVIAVAVAGSLLYGGGLSGRALLLRPLVDDVALPSASISAVDEVLEGATAGEQLQSEEERELLRQRVADNFFQVLIAGMFLVLAMPLVRLVRDYASQWVMLRIHADLQAHLGDKLMRLPLATHVREGRGDFIARLSSDTAIANRAHMVVFETIIPDVAITLVALGLLAYLNWQLTLGVLLLGPPVAFVLQVFGRRIRKSSQRRQEQVSDVTQRLLQMLAGVKVIKAFHAEEREQASFRASVMLYFKRAMKVVRNRVLSRSLVELTTQASFVALILTGIWMVAEGRLGLTLGTFMAFVTVAAMLYRPVRGAAAVYNDIQNALPAAVRIFEVLDAEEVTPDRPDAVAIDDLRESIRYENVSFGYDRGEVLRGVDLEIAAGEVVALVGRSGAGKTTIADLLLRFHEPNRGRILIDGRDLRDIQRASLLGLTGLVTQEPFLFAGSILDNIRYGRPDASFEEVVEAARAAQVHEFIESLPQGYDTGVGELGGMVSGGQRQRLTIARAVLRNPRILIFDEATSALDAKSEQQVQRAIANLMRDRTVLLIAHRLSTVKSADKIAVVEDGRVSMVGRHDELVAREGLYRELVEAQLTPEISAA